MGMLLAPFHYSKGSLGCDDLPELPMTTELSISTIEKLNNKCHLLPSIKEGCFSSDEQMDIESTLKFYFGTLLHSCAAKVNGELYVVGRSPTLA